MSFMTAYQIMNTIIERPTSKWSTGDKNRDIIYCPRVVVPPQGLQPLPPREPSQVPSIHRPLHQPAADSSPKTVRSNQSHQLPSATANSVGMSSRCKDIFDRPARVPHPTS